MNEHQLFTLALGLGGGWQVVKVSFEAEAGQLDLELDFKPGSRFACPECGQASPVHDTVQKRWRHLNFFQHEAYLSARMPRVRCGQHGVRLVAVPWARPESGFTLLFEALVLALIKQMPVAAVARLVGEYDTRLWRLLKHYVSEAHASSDWSGVRQIAIDETSARRGHRYVTNVIALGSKESRLLFMTPDRESATVGGFVKALRSHGGQPGQIAQVAMDMSPAYLKGVSQEMPLAQIVYDPYHLMAKANEAMDAVRRGLQGQADELKGTRWLWLRNEWNLNHQQHAALKELAGRYRPLGKAYSLKVALQDFYIADAQSAPGVLRGWCRWAKRSRLEPFVELAALIQRHLGGILNYFSSRITQGTIEAINGLIQLAKRRARGYRSFENLRTMAYLIAGKLTLKLPVPLPT
jgi:transposase